MGAAGKSTLDMLEKIADVLGRPTDEQCKSLNSPFTATMMENIDYAKLGCAERTFSQQVDKWREAFPRASDDAVDLLGKLLQFDPTQRMGAIDGLSHPYCVQFFPEDSKPDLAATRGVTSFADPTLSEDKKRGRTFEDTHAKA